MFISSVPPALLYDREAIEAKVEAARLVLHVGFMTDKFGDRSYSSSPLRLLLVPVSFHRPV